MTALRRIPVQMLGVLLLGLFAILLPAQDIDVVAPESVGISSSRLARLDRVMQDYVDQQKLAGIVVLVARHGSVVHHRAFGMADIDFQTMVYQSIIE
jgi:hypothetical protein